MSDWWGQNRILLTLQSDLKRGWNIDLNNMQSEIAFGCVNFCALNHSLQILTTYLLSNISQSLQFWQICTTVDDLLLDDVAIQNLCDMCRDKHVADVCMIIPVSRKLVVHSLVHVSKCPWLSLLMSRWSLSLMYLESYVNTPDLLFMFSVIVTCEIFLHVVFTYRIHRVNDESIETTEINYHCKKKKYL